MKKLHSKSPCCRGIIYRFGQRRRQCSLCKKTWRIRLKKRGRKQRRVHPDISRTVLERGESLRHQAKRLKKNRESLRRKHHQNLEHLLKRLPKPIASGGSLIAVVDGWAVTIKGERYTVYLILLRAVSDNRAVVMEPYITKGYEHLPAWKVAFEELPNGTKKRICALVSDGLTGMHGLAREYGWVYQRCHFHLLKMMQSLRGKRWSTVKHKALRENMYQMIVAILQAPTERCVLKLSYQLRQSLANPKCPKWFALRTRGFFKQLAYFRSYRHFTDLHLPTTTNSAENICRALTNTKRKARGFSSVASLRLWVIVQIRTMKPILCNGKSINQISMS
jgi:hypothetical protein